MIFIKQLLKTLLKYDTDEEKLYRFNKIKKCFTWINPDIKYDENDNRFSYNKIGIDKKKFFIHRLIYYICHDDFDIFDSKVTIDHINVNHLDNKLKNLRTATHAQQQRNRLNWGGELINGYHIRTDGRKKKYLGYYSKNGKLISKSFLTANEAKAFHDNNTERF